jgi:hypothetical protein
MAQGWFGGSPAYIPDQASWLKIRKTNYSQWKGREELFNQERESDPDLSLGDDCVRACDVILSLAKD